MLKRTTHPAYFFLLGMLLVCVGCSESRKTAPRAFYHWQTKLELSPAERGYLDSLKVKRIYAKYFDVDWNAEAGEPTPRALIRWGDNPDFSYELVPVVFITNRSLLNSEDDDMRELAENIIRSVLDLRKLQPLPPLRELQIDCDWSGKSKDKYFRLLKQMRSQLDSVQLSATIRLHQVKYFDKTGVPPVDRGMLMYYNMGKVSEIQTQNSIFDSETARTYHLNFEEYPLPLDVVLPAWSWGIVFRNGKMIRILNRLRIEDLKDKKYYEKLDAGRVKVKQSHYLEGHYLYGGDVLRIETVSLADLETATQDLKPLLVAKTLRIAFYPIDSQTPVHYPYEKLENLYRSFSH